MREENVLILPTFVSESLQWKPSGLLQVKGKH